MYLLLILLVAPAFGRPSSGQPDNGAEVAKQLDDIVNFTNETGKIFVNSSVIENVIKMLLEAEQNILEMNAELKTLETEQIKFKDNYFPAYNEAKSYLRETRQGLRKLARKTVTHVRDSKILLGGFDKNKDPIFLKFTINKVRDLMIETLESLKEAKEKYNSAIETFGNLNHSIKIQNKQLTNLLTNVNDTKALLDSQEIIALSSYTTAIIIADIFGCLGFCSAIVTPTITILMVSTRAANDKEKLLELEKLKLITEKMLESGENFDNAINGAIYILSEEIELLGIWTQSAKTVSDNIDNYSEEVLGKFQSLRKIFIKGLDNLKDVAEQFLAKPTDILGR